jgi:hypothetical protein
MAATPFRSSGSPSDNYRGESVPSRRAEVTAVYDLVVDAYVALWSLVILPAAPSRRVHRRSIIVLIATAAMIRIPRTMFCQ